MRGSISHCSRGGWRSIVDARHGAFAHADAGTAISGDDAAQELEKIGIVSHQEYAIAVGILLQQLLESDVIRIRPQRRTDLDLGFVSQFCADELRGLQGPLQGTRGNHVHLHLQRAQHARHEHALFFSFFDESALGIETGDSPGKLRRWRGA